jgi:hypothetical protein
MLVTGPIEALHAAMFRQQDAHVTAYRRWRFLFESGICDRDGVILIGRQKGQRIKS